MIERPCDNCPNEDGCVQIDKCSKWKEYIMDVFNRKEEPCLDEED